MTSFLKRYSLGLILIIATVGCDQATKLVVRSSLKGIGMSTYLGDTFRLMYTENSGAFLSLGAQMSESARLWIFVGLTSLFLLYVAYSLFTQPWQGLQSVGLSLILGGGIGNLIDRFVRGRVIDFMNMGIGSLRTGIFNVADVAIMIGVALVFFAHYWPAKSHQVY